MSTPSLTARQRSAAAELRALLARRIAVLEGPKGTMVQARGLSEADFRGACFCGHSHDLRGDNDILNLTQPALIEDIHRAYIDAGADIVSTNTFNGTRISQADYAAESSVADLNRAAAELCVRAALAGEARHQRRIFVAGAIGPTNRTLSLSPDVNRPDYRAVTFDEVVTAYYEQARSLVAGGAELLLVETIFDTLNAKAAVYAIHQLFDELGEALPLSISVTVTDASGRTLSGQTVRAFYHSIRHAQPFSVGLNCALGGAQMRPYLEELAGLAECYVSCYPNAGLPNAFGGYDEKPEDMARVLGEFAANGWLNIAGGCCGSTPAHIAAIAGAVAPHAPRPRPTGRAELLLSGLEPLAVA
ncbi:homocysteine S-methyltransferase family protein [Opitutus terrae]|uniref:homocysteine S-methyltransferase family protein n=1 Tax=Opitutus terrae TaxID=107709 RepID=UPI0002FF81A1|nr:homocysteine S-methyltransferase family protein [Opitutus terrae]